MDKFRIRENGRSICESVDDVPDIQRTGIFVAIMKNNDCVTKMTYVHSTRRKSHLFSFYTYKQKELLKETPEMPCASLRDAVKAMQGLSYNENPEYPYSGNPWKHPKLVSLMEKEQKEPPQTVGTTCEKILYKDENYLLLKVVRLCVASIATRDESAIYRTQQKFEFYSSGWNCGILG